MSFSCKEHDDYYFGNRKGALDEHI